MTHSPPAITTPAPIRRHHGQPWSGYDSTAWGEIERLALALPLTVPNTIVDPDATPEDLPLLQLRFLLTFASTTQQAKDDAWRHLATRALTRDPAWNLFALGVAKPKLGMLSQRLSAGLSAERRRVLHFRMAGDFLLVLHNTNLDRPNIFMRVVDAAFTATSGRKKRREPYLSSLDAVPGELLPTSPFGRPAEEFDQDDRDERAVLRDWAAQANARGGRVTDRHIALIERTYLDGESLRMVAAKMGITESTASRVRARAISALLEGVRDRRLGPTEP